MAASARSCERRAKASASVLVMPSRSPTNSPVSVIENVALSRAARRGLTNRQPSDESTISPGLPKARSGLARIHGARVIDSTPPAMTTSASPALIMLAVRCTAERPDAHNRLTVIPGTESGRPASRTAMRATLRLSSPAWFASPKMTSSIIVGSTPLRATSSAMAMAARSSGRTLDNEPPYRPIGVRTPSTTNASVMVSTPLRGGHRVV